MNDLDISDLARNMKAIYLVLRHVSFVFPHFHKSEAEILFGKSNKNGLLFCCQFFALSKCEIGFDTTYQLASLDLSERDERMIWHLRILDTTANCKNPSQLLLHTHLFYNYPSNPIIRRIE